MSILPFSVLTDLHGSRRIFSIKIFRSSHAEVFWRKGVLKICSTFTGEHPCRSVISGKLLCNFIEITLRHGHSAVNLLHIFRTPFPKNTSWTATFKYYYIVNLLVTVTRQLNSKMPGNKLKKKIRSKHNKTFKKTSGMI